MNKKLGMITVFTILLTNLFTLVFIIQQVNADWVWTETIYIRADGGIEPIAAPIFTVDKVTYVLPDNIVGDVPDNFFAIVS